MVNDEDKDAVPELVRAMALSSCHLDPVVSFVPVLERLCASGVSIGDVLADSGYADRRAESFALPMRALGASLVMDLHPNDRGPQGTFAGAVLHNGNLYCPATPTALLEIGPLARDASLALVEAHDKMTAELSCYKLGRITANDTDGYHRVSGPAVMAKCRCPLRRDSMGLSFNRPEVIWPPGPAPKCCLQQSITVPPSVTRRRLKSTTTPQRPTGALMRGGPLSSGRTRG